MTDRQSPPRNGPALALWVGSRVAVVLLTVGAGWLLPAGDRGPTPRFLDQWHHWDTDLYRKIAEFGYFSPHYTDRAEAFFPGLPTALRLVHALVPDWIAAGLVVSALAGAVASVALYRLAVEDQLASGSSAAEAAETGHRTVLYLVLFPYAVFLFAGYAEALFLAFAATSWLAARHERWWLAGLLGAGASFTRVSGVALGLALGVEFLTRRGWRGLLHRDVAALVLPALPVAGYLTYLHARTGHWDAFTRAEAQGWGRHVVNPVTALRTTWHLAFGPGEPRAFQWSWRAELLALFVGAAVAVVLLLSRRWGEATFVGVNVALLSTSSFYASNVRGLLVWFPAFLLLGRLARRVPGLHAGVVTVFAPLCALTTLAFTEGTWLG